MFSQRVYSSLPWEIVIIDNASTDNTAEFCLKQKIQLKFEGNFRVVLEEKQGANHARLRALREARYKWILFCDDDNHLFVNYVQRGYDYLKNEKKIGALGGKGIPLFEDKKPPWFDRFSHSYAVGHQSNFNGRIQAFPASIYSAGSFFNKEALLKILDGDFSTIMIGPNEKQLTRGEDTEWCYLLQMKGYDLWYLDELNFYHSMTASRLKWEYYLRLKEGISLGTALTFTYIFFLKSKNKGIFFFLINYVISWLKALLVRSKFFFKKLFCSGIIQNKEYEVGEIILKAKLRSYSNNLIKALKHYRSILKAVKQDYI